MFIITCSIIISHSNLETCSKELHKEMLLHLLTVKFHYLS